MQRSPVGPSGSGLRTANAPRAIGRADSLGHRVPRAPFEGVVLGASRRSALFAVQAELLAVVATPQGRGPAVVRLAALPADGMDCWFVAGEACQCADGWLNSARVSIDLRGAAVWRPPAPQARADGAPLARRVRALRAALRAADIASAGAQREAWADAAPAIIACCRVADADAAFAAAVPLIGSGSGSTPAGDDFLVGLLAGLGALVCSDATRGRFVAAFASALAAAAARRTTALSAQHLRHAADGDFGEPLVRLRDAVTAASDDRALMPALAAALAVGASSGAAGAAGLTSGIEAWIEMPCARR